MTTHLDPLSSAEWGESHARHLLNRAGFGVPRERVGQLAQWGRDKAVNALVDYDELPVRHEAPDWLPDSAAYYAFRAAFQSAPPGERAQVRVKFVREERTRIARLRSWWLDRMLTTPRPLEEKMTLFWHGHFATSSRKVRESLPAYELNEVFRRHATGNFKQLTTDVGQSRSMLDYLDNQRNVKGSPNENWARELMELFTLGVGEYSEKDIKESARAFTGWKFNDAGFIYAEDAHDFGEKNFFGKRGNFDGWDILDIIFQQPAAAEFISAKLWTFFAYDEPERELVQGLASVLRESHFDLKPVLRVMFNSRAFYSARSMGTQIKSPVQLVLQVAHDLRLAPAPYAAMARQSGELGQDLFEPPNVKGWEGGRRWINANSLVSRYNLPKTMLTAAVVAERLGEGRGKGTPGSMAMNDMEPDSQPGMKIAQRVRNTLNILPRQERRALQEEMRDTKLYERRDLIEQYMLERPLEGLWEPRRLLDGLAFERAGECVDALAVRYLATEISAENRTVLLSALTGGTDSSAVLAADSVDDVRLEETFRLLLSMAEYQLC